MIIDKLIAAYDEYIALLNEELSELVGLAVVHGWKSTRYKAGVAARAGIAALKSDVRRSTSGNTAMPKLPDFDMENVRCLESFIAHRACVGAPAWSAWSEVKKFIVAVRQLRQ